MRKEYQAIMEHIRLTDEDRARILENATQADPAEPQPRARRWKPGRPARTFALAACLALVLMGAFLPKLLADSPMQTGGPEQALPPVVHTYGSRQELETALGFSLSLPKTLPFQADRVIYQSMDDMAQVDYQSADGQETATFRQSPGSEDNSGDYSAYDTSTRLTLDGREIRLEGYDGTYCLAVWTDGGYACSLSLSTGVAETVWTEILP